MTRMFVRLLRRVLVAALGVFAVWLIVFVVFRFADNRLPWILAAAFTYAVAAYVILPRLCCRIFRLVRTTRGRIT